MIGNPPRNVALFRFMLVVAMAAVGFPMLRFPLSVVHTVFLLGGAVVLVLRNPLPRYQWINVNLFYWTWLVAVTVTTWRSW